MVAAGVTAADAWERRAGATGDRRFALAMIALHLREPIVNVFLIPAGILIAGMAGGERAFGMQAVALAVASIGMAPLLLPARGLRSRDPLVASTCRTLLVLGLLRWAWTALSLAAGFAGMLMALPGSALLWLCGAAGSGLAARLGPRTAAMPPAATPPVRVEPLSDWRAG